jgi:hypothetical protein
MNGVTSVLGVVAVLGCSSAALAGEITVNFQEMADVNVSAGGWGESAWTTLSLNDFSLDVDITGTYSGNDSDVYAYLDRGTAGLGTCRNLTDAGAFKKDTKRDSGGNLCAPSSDDNVNVISDSTGVLGVEGLKFTFNEVLTVKKIWLNNNHDPDYGMGGDTVIIDGSNHTFGATPDDADLGWLFEFGSLGKQFNVGEMLTVQYYNLTNTTQLHGEEFYISAVLFDDTPTDTDIPVPVPSTLVLLGLGLAGLGARKPHK